jgi:hypothetical protein
VRCTHENQSLLLCLRPTLDRRQGRDDFVDYAISLMGAEAAAAPTAVAPSDGFEGCGGSVAEAVDLHLQSAVENLLFCKFAATHVIWKAKVWGRNEVTGGPLGPRGGGSLLHHGIGKSRHRREMCCDCKRRVVGR